MPHVARDKRRTGESLPSDQIERIRQILGGDTSRDALSGFGVSYNTMVSALAGFPIAKGSRVLIEKALEERTGATGE